MGAIVLLLAALLFTACPTADKEGQNDQDEGIEDDMYSEEEDTSELETFFQEDDVEFEEEIPDSMVLIHDN